MKIKFVVFAIIVLMQLPIYSQKKRCVYEGMEVPGVIEKQFVLNEFFNEGDNMRRSFNFTFSPDFKEMFFSFYKATKENPSPEYEIKRMKYVDGKWVGPSTAGFSGVYSDVDINYSPDGKYIFFASDRPQPHSADLDIYYCVKTNNGWSKPIYCGINVNTVHSEVYPSVSLRGNVFYRSMQSGGYSGSDLYRAAWRNGNFVDVKNLGPNVNSPYGQTNAVVAPDESYILYCTRKPGMENIQEIFISFQIGDNVWTKGESVGAEVNSGGRTGAPTLTSDGKYLFFSRFEQGEPNLYWISTQIINKLKVKYISGPYFNQKEPSVKSELFGRGILPNPDKFNLGLCFMNKGKELYYSQWEKNTINIRCRKLENGIWGMDTIVSFCSEHKDWDLTFSPDGKRIYFSSKRPLEKSKGEKSDADIWYVEKTKEGWGEAVHLGEIINSEKDEVHPSVASNGNIYMFGPHGPNISCAKFVNGEYTSPEKLGEEVNSEFVELDPLVAPDESYLIFHSNRPGGYGGNDLYICFRDKEQNKWSKAINMGENINTKESDYCARISQDGRFLFFSRRRAYNKGSDFYWVSTKIIDDLREEAK